VAAVDLGSVSTQVLLTNGIERIRRSADTLMGGSELSPAGEVRGRAISGEALERVALALRDFAELLDRHPSTPAKRVVATESARQALNRNELADLVAAILGCDLHVIDGAEEARLSFSGAVSDLAL
jgi:exopolyphosphatase/guanosine-5'-triphosphate,3'-diphosphate pyrophosphatase